MVEIVGLLLQIEICVFFVIWYNFVLYMVQGIIGYVFLCMCLQFWCYVYGEEFKFEMFLVWLGEYNCFWQVDGILCYQLYDRVVFVIEVFRDLVFYGFVVNSRKYYDVFFFYYDGEEVMQVRVGVLAFIFNKNIGVRYWEELVISVIEDYFGELYQVFILLCIKVQCFQQEKEKYGKLDIYILFGFVLMYLIRVVYYYYIRLFRLVKGLLSFL